MPKKIKIDDFYAVYEKKGTFHLEQESFFHCFSGVT